MIKILKNFLSENEIKSLNSWCMDNYTENFFSDPGMDLYYPRTRLTTRSCKTSVQNIKINYPKESYEIQKRLKDNLNLQNILYPPPFCDGIVSGIGFENGSIFRHCDPVYFNNTYTLHCNFITQKSVSGGVTIINDIEYDINVNDALIYIVSHQEHEVTKIVGNIPRILWCYGFCITEQQLKNIFKS